MEVKDGDLTLEKTTWIETGRIGSVACAKCPATIRDGDTCWISNRGETIWCESCGNKHVVKGAL